MNYTYGKLIQGDIFSLNFHEAKVRHIIKTGKNMEELSYHKSKAAYFVDEIARYTLQQAVCGDEIVVVN